MRIATFNILHGRSPVDDRVDLDRYAKAVRELDADVLALQEVDRFQARSENADLTAVAAEAMGATEHRFVAALTGTPGATWISATGDEQPDSTAYGVALLSRYPVRAWEVIRLPGVPVRVPMFFKGSRKPELVRDEPRVAVAAFVDSPLGEVMVVNTHLSFIGWWNRRQLRTLTRSLPEPERTARPRRRPEHGAGPRPSDHGDDAAGRAPDLPGASAARAARPRPGPGRPWRGGVVGRARAPTVGPPGAVGRTHPRLSSAASQPVRCSEVGLG